MVNPTNGSVIVNPQKSIVALGCTASYVLGGPNGVVPPWELFSQWCAVATQIVETHTPIGTTCWRFTQRYQCELTSDSGLIQFRAARKVTYADHDYKAGELINIYLFDNACDVTNSYHPSVITVIPEASQTFVVMKPGQTLQIILPADSVFSPTHRQQYGPLRFLKKVPSEDGSHYSLFFYCHSPVQHCAELIYFAQKDQTFLVSVPAITSSGVSELSLPMDEFVLYPNDTKNFRLFSQKTMWLEARNGWLDRTAHFKVESYGRENSTHFADVRLTVAAASQKIPHKLKIEQFFNPDACTAI